MLYEETSNQQCLGKEFVIFLCLDHNNTKNSEGMIAVLVHVGKINITYKKKPVAAIDLNINLKFMSSDDERIENYIRMLYI